jgi:glycosyltransferase involved in cell wall biosynthesis
VLFVGRTRYRFPLEASLQRKFDALERVMAIRVLAPALTAARNGDARFALVPPRRPQLLDGALFYAMLPFRIARELARFRPDAVLAENALTALAAIRGRKLAGRETPVVLEVHGDWRSSMRLYGSPLRRLLAPLADRAALDALRRADAVRTLSPATETLVRSFGVEPTSSFPAYVDVSTFLEEPPRTLPDRPQALFVGVLERYKNVDGLVAAWRAAAPRIPEARLRIVGDGALRDLVRRLVHELPAQTSWEPEIVPEEVAHALDESSILVLPSRSEGLPRIALEALCRCRPVLATRVGGVPDLIEDGVTGFVIEPEDVGELTEALVRVLGMPEALEPLTAEGRRGAEAWIQTPEQFAERVLELVARARGDGRPRVTPPVPVAAGRY